MSLLHRDDPCTFVHEKLELFLDGELTGSENLAFQTHLKECEICAAYWSDDEEVSTALMLAVAPDRILASDRLFSAGLPSTTPARTEFDRSRDTERRPALSVSSWGRRLSLAAAAAGVAALAFGAGLFFNEGQGERTPPIENPSAALASNTDLSVISWRGACRVRSDEAGARDSDWRVLRADEALVGGMQVLAEPNEGDLFLAIDSAGAVVVKEGSILKLAKVDADGSSPVDLGLLHGQASFDFASRAFQVTSPGASYEGRDATFVVRSDQIEESVVVLRGELDLRVEDEVSTLGVHDRRLLRGQERVGTDSQGQTARIEAELLEAQLLIADLRRELTALNGMNSELQESLEAATSAEAPTSPSEIVAAYLHVVGQTNSYDLDVPSPFTKATAAKLLPFGSEAVTVIGGFFVAEEAANRRRACLGLLTELRLPESRRALERACFDRNPAMRGIALYCLTKLPDTDLGRHFLSVARTDRNEDVRYRAAVCAARSGEDEGVTILVQLYHGTKDKHRRTRVVSRVARLENDLPSVSPFLRSVLLNRNSDRFSILAAISGLVARRDVEALSALRELVERADLSTDLRGRVEAAIHDLEVD